MSNMEDFDADSVIARQQGKHSLHLEAMYKRIKRKDAARERMLSRLSEKTCTICGDTFKQKSLRQKMCGKPECLKKYRNQKNAEYRQRKVEKGQFTQKKEGAMVYPEVSHLADKAKSTAHVSPEPKPEAKGYQGGSSKFHKRMVWVVRKWYETHAVLSKENYAMLEQMVKMLGDNRAPDEFPKLEVENNASR